VRRALLVLASDRVAAGERADRTAAGLQPLVVAAGLEWLAPVVVPDEVGPLEAALRAGIERADLVLTSGGTGIGPRDVTPEATAAVIEKELPGFGEQMRAVSLGKAPGVALSRATAGTAGTSLIVNLPGSPKGAAECLTAVLGAALHGLELLASTVADCAPLDSGASKDT